MTSGKPGEPGHPGEQGVKGGGTGGTGGAGGHGGAAPSLRLLLLAAVMAVAIVTGLVLWLNHNTNTIDTNQANIERHSSIDRVTLLASCQLNNRRWETFSRLLRTTGAEPATQRTLVQLSRALELNPDIHVSCNILFKGGA